MQVAQIIDINEATREKIVNAAFKRFRHYGYNKTTMAEIADDCGMSAANLYRFFISKQDIAAACVDNCIDQRLIAIKQSVQSETSSASQQLRTLILTTLRCCHNIFQNDEKIYELIGYITDEKPGVVHNKISVIQAEIKSILEFGNQTGEFCVEDLTATASAIYTSIALFDTPIFMGFYSIDKFEQLATEVYDLIIRGITRQVLVAE